MALGKIGTNQIDTAATPTVASATVTGDLTVDTNTLYVDSTNNRVGIGTISPASNLHIYNTSYPALRFDDGTAYSSIYNDSTDGSLVYSADDGNARAGSKQLFYVDGSEKMRIDSSGRVTMPYQPSFGVYTTTGQTVGNTIQFNGTSFNIGNHFNTSTGIFTAPVAGRYWFFWHLLTDRSTNTGEAYVDLYKNGGYHYRNYEPKENSINQHLEFKGGLIVDMATNDTVYLVYTVAVSGNIVGSLQHCTFSGFLIG